MAVASRARDSPGGERGRGGGDTFAAVFRVVEQWRQGCEVRSFDALAPLYRHDDNTVVVYQGRSHVGWTSGQSFAAARASRARAAIHLRLEDGQVTALGGAGATFVGPPRRASSPTARSPSPTSGT